MYQSNITPEMFSKQPDQTVEWLNRLVTANNQLVQRVNRLEHTIQSIRR